MEFTIKFRAFRLDDAAFINKLRTIENMERMIGGSLRPVSYDRDMKWIEDIIMNDRQDIIYLAITMRDNDEIIGYTSLGQIDYRNGNCYWSGIKLGPEQAGKGIGRQVGLKILKYVFEELRMERCKGECLEHHEVVLKMIEHIGYKKEGLMRHSVYKNGQYNNQWIFSVISEDYKEIKKKFDL